MPKSWSNHHIQHIDIDPTHRGMPPSALVVIAFGVIAFCAVTILAVRLVMHPVQTPVDESKPYRSPVQVGAHS